jgi:hypothetical protein
MADDVASALLQTAADRDGLAAALRTAGSSTLGRNEFHALWGRFGSEANADVVYDSCRGMVLGGCPVARILTLLHTPTALAPNHGSMCVGFSVAQRRSFMTLASARNPSLMLTPTEFADAFEEARGYRPSDDLLNRILAVESGNDAISAVEFSKYCCLSPLAVSAIPFLLHHVRKQKVAHSRFLGLFVYVPFVALITAFVLSGRHLETGRDFVSAVDNVVRSAPAASDCASVGACDLSAPLLRFDDVDSNDALFDWLTATVGSVWRAFAGHNNTAEGPLQLSIAALGSFRVRAVRFDPESDSEVAIQYFHYHDNTTVRFRRVSVSKDPILPGVPPHFAPPVRASFEYRSCDDLNSSVSHTGAVRTYDCGGHALDIPFSTPLPEALAYIDALRRHNWLAGEVGAVFIEFFAFNVNELAAVHYVLYKEIEVGGAWANFHSFSLADVFTFQFKQPTVIALASVVAATVLAYFGRLVFEIWNGSTRRLRGIGGSGVRARLYCIGKTFEDDPWLVLDVLSLALLASSTVVRWIAIYLLTHVVHDLHQTRHYPRYLERIANLSVGVTYLDAATIVLLYFKALRYASLFRPMRVLAATVYQSFLDLTGTAFAFTVLFISFTVSAYMAYGRYLPQFAAVEEAGSALLRAVLGDLDYAAMNKVQPFFTPLFFAIFSVAIVLVALNMVIAILTGAFEHAYEDAYDLRSPTRLAAMDPRCILSTRHRSLLDLARRLPVVQEVRYRVLRFLTPQDTPLGHTFRNARKLYGALDEVLTACYSGTRQQRIGALSTLAEAMAHWTPHTVRYSRLQARTSEPTEGSADFNAFLRATFHDQADVIMQIAVWIPGYVLRVDALDLLERAAEDHVEWRRHLGRLAFVDEEPPVVDHARSAKESAALTFETKMRTPAELGEPAPHAPPTDDSSLRDARISRHRAMALEFTPRQRSAVLALAKGVEDAPLYRWADWCQRVANVIPEAALRAASSDGLLVTSEFRAHCCEDGTIVSDTAFLAFLTNQEHRTAVDFIRVWGYTLFFVLFLSTAVLDKGLGDGIRPTSSDRLEQLQAGPDPATTFGGIRSPPEFYGWLRQVSATAEAVLNLDSTMPSVGSAIKIRQLRASAIDCQSDLPSSSTHWGDDLATVTAAHNRPQGCGSEFELTEARTFLRNATLSALMLPATEREWVRSAFSWKSESELRSFGATFGATGVYVGSGYGEFLPVGNSTRRIDLLEALNWIDHRTRMVAVDLCQVSFSANMIVLSTYVVEIPAGGAWTSFAAHLPARPWNLEVKSTISVLALVLLVVWELYYVQQFFDDLVSAVQLRTKTRPAASVISLTVQEFFSGFWWANDVVRHGTFITLFILKVYVIATGLGDVEVTDLTQYPRALEPLTKVTRVYELLESVATILCGTKLLQYFETSAELGVFTATVARAWRPVLALILATFVFLLAFAVSGFSLFGELSAAFASFGDSLASLLLVTTLGSFDGMSDIHDQNRVTYSVFFVAFIFAVKIVLLNMFIAVLTNAFAEVKEQIFDARDLDRVMRNDPDFAAEHATIRERISKSSIAQEAVYVFRRLASCCTGTSLEQIRLENPRRFWRTLSTLLTALELGSPSERHEAAIGLHAIVENCVPRVEALDVAQQGRIQRATVHGYMRRTTCDLLAEELGAERVAEWVFVGAQMPCSYLGWSAARSLGRVLQANHLWRHQLHMPADSTDDNDTEAALPRVQRFFSGS